MTYSDCGYGRVAEFALEHLKTARQDCSIQSIIIYQEEDFGDTAEPLIDLLTEEDGFPHLTEVKVRYQSQAIEFSKLTWHWINVVSFVDPS